jgi:hypothetical protein
MSWLVGYEIGKTRQKFGVWERRHTAASRKARRPQTYLHCQPDNRTNDF